MNEARESLRFCGDVLGPEDPEVYSCTLRHQS